MAPGVGRQDLRLASCPVLPMTQIAQAPRPAGDGSAYGLPVHPFGEQLHIPQMSGAELLEHGGVFRVAFKVLYMQ